MQNHNLKIMAVDDDEVNLEILVKNLKDYGYSVEKFEDGDVAWEYLSNNPEDIDIVLLDKMMPRMNGMEVLSKMKEDPNLKEIPVIIQTADAGIKETKEGLEAGAYYYLTKPFDPSTMVALVNAAARDFVERNSILKEIKSEKSISKMLVEGKFRLHTIEEAKKLAVSLAFQADQQKDVSISLSELMVNAIEHGNYGMGYEKKSKLLKEGTYSEEIKKLESLPENTKKYIEVIFLRKQSEIAVKITDQGKGFEWQKYLEFDPLRLTDINGRGVAVAGVMGTKIKFVGNGSSVICRFTTKQS